MLSILIPTYNYNAFPLVSELEKQCLECEIAFEIIVIDDGGNQFENENQKINDLKNCNFSRNYSNLGRGKNINFLTDKTKFEWLLIMDCDTFPTKNNFIQKYISQINKGEKVVYGGIEYQKEKPDNDRLLRWFYGKNREALSVEKRNSNPNGNALTSNILIKKDVLTSNKFNEAITEYGYEDLVFLSALKKKKIIVKHIDNPTYHLGIETSKQFLDKTKIALKNLNLITKTNCLDHSESKILRTHFLLKRVRLVNFTSFLFKKLERKIEHHLQSEKPSLLLFDFYKLGYFCTLKK